MPSALSKGSAGEKQRQNHDMQLAHMILLAHKNTASWSYLPAPQPPAPILADAAPVLAHSKFMPASFAPRLACACSMLLAGSPSSLPQSKAAGAAPAAFPSQETISYSIEWRLIYAGYARLSLNPKMSAGKQDWQSKLHLESGGMVSKLYKLEDNYTVQMEDKFCAASSDFNSMERNRHHQTAVNYDHAHGKASYVERDLLKNSIFKTAETEIPACVSDIIGGLYKLRSLKLEPGQSMQLPISDGKKTVSARIEAQQREQLKIKGGTFNTIRYEVFVFNGVLYARKAELFVWLSDDARRLPVQIRARMGFPIGSITFELEKEEHS
jgi:hypothetical protein